MKFLFIIGPSGSGKTKWEKVVCTNYFLYHRVISVTTRDMREGEVHGEDYYFINAQELRVLRDNNKLIEDNTFKGNFYGASKEHLSEDKINVVVIETKGLKQAVDYCHDNGFDYEIIFIDLEPEVLRENLMSRDGNLNRLNDGIRESYIELYESSEDSRYSPTITINKMLSDKQIITIAVGVSDNLIKG